MYKTRKTGDGRYELWWEDETIKNILGVYDTQEELEHARKMIQKHEERSQFLSHTLKDGKRRKVVVRDPEYEESDQSEIQTVIISDDMQQIGRLNYREIDLLISLGDLMDTALVKASEIYQPVRVLAVRGNHDDVQPFQKPIVDLHLQVTEVKGTTFGGFSGSWRYKEGEGHLYTQKQVSRMLDNFPSVDVFIAHNSPGGVHERDQDIHQGFSAFTDYIERVQPTYFIHGHQHVNKTTKIGHTKVMGLFGEAYLEFGKKK